MKIMSDSNNIFTENVLNNHHRVSSTSCVWEIQNWNDYALNFYFSSS